MNDDIAKGYTVRKWLKNIWTQEDSILRQEPSWKFRFWLGLYFIAFGILQIFMFRNGLLEWWRVVSMSYEEVSKTPFFPMWTSGRAIAGFIWLLTGFVWLAQGLSTRKRRLKEKNTK